MTTFRVTKVHVGAELNWAVIATNANGSQNWKSLHLTEAEARAECDRLGALSIQKKNVRRNDLRPNALTSPGTGDGQR